MTGKRKYEDDVVPFLSKAMIIELSPTDIELVRQFALQFQKAKSTEYIHQIDDEQEIKRYMTGFSAELALEKMLGVRILDTTLGKSENYHHADLKSNGINVGIKCAHYGNYPVVFKQPYNAEIVTVLRDNKVYVCGIASVQTMLKYADDDLILNAKLRARGVKSGFYGFEHLIPFSNLTELKTICKNLPPRPWYK
jgi:hypothetical protein